MIRQKLVVGMLVFLLCLPLGSMGAQPPDIASLKAGALAGDAWAQLNLGAAYDHGLAGVEENPPMAVAWYRKAAEQGLDKAQFNLAHCLATGHGTAQDFVQARFWMHKAAEQGMPDAQFLIGVLLADGLGGEPDRAAARAWLRKAQAGGNPNAGDYLKKLR